MLNRSVEHARVLAERTGDGYAALDELPTALSRADLVVSATGAAETVIDLDTIRAALPRARSNPLVLVDLAVPRDVDPAVGGLDGVRLIDILSIRERLMSRGDKTVGDIVHAHEIVAEEVRRWTVRRRSDALAPLIRAVQRRGDDIVRMELARHAKRLIGLTPDERAAVEALARGIAAKLLHDPIVGLKELSEPGTDDAHARLLGRAPGHRPRHRVTLRIGTRRSPLALAQAEEIRRRLSEHGVSSEIVPMSTSGDEGAPSADVPGGLKGLFVDTILDALEREAIDVAVHSAKDLPADDEEGLVIAAVPPRADPSDLLVLREATLPAGAVIGTSSIRRRAQLFRAFPGVLLVRLSFPQAFPQDRPCETSSRQRSVPSRPDRWASAHNNPPWRS